MTQARWYPGVRQTPQRHAGASWTRRWLTVAAAATVVVITAAAPAARSALPKPAGAQVTLAVSATPTGNQQDNTGAHTAATVLGTAAVTDLSPAQQAAADAVTPAVVDIDSTSEGAGLSSGTGILLGPDGLVLTSRHVVAGATEITATAVATGTKYQAAVMGYDTSEDIAVLQLTGASGLPVATIGNSAGIPIGTQVVAVGNAGGEGGKPAAEPGEVIGRNRAITVTDPADGTEQLLRHLIAVSAPLQAGQSGGPLVDLSGAVVGVNAAASFTATGRSTSGWAVPIHRAMAVVAAVQGGTEVRGVHIGPPGFLGIQLTSAQGSGGARVAGVVPGSAAEAAGLATGDRITRAAGRKIPNGQALSRAIGRTHPGEQVKLRVRTGAGKTRTVVVTLGQGPAA